MIRRAGLALFTLAFAVLAAAPAQAATPSSALSASLGMRIDGPLWRQHAGVFVAAAGDVNGDGARDIAVAAPRTDFVREQSGSVYVGASGGPSGWA